MEEHGRQIEHEIAKIFYDTLMNNRLLSTIMHSACSQRADNRKK
jgi:hypothetical protein